MVCKSWAKNLAWLPQHTGYEIGDKDKCDDVIASLALRKHAFPSIRSIEFSSSESELETLQQVVDALPSLAIMSSIQALKMTVPAKGSTAEQQRDRYQAKVCGSMQSPCRGIHNRLLDKYGFTAHTHTIHRRQF